MDAHGYILNGNSKTAAPGYFPSLIGVEPDQVNPNKGDPYFARIEVTDRRITTIARSRWVCFDSLPSATRDPILAVRTVSGSYYIPASELFEIAAFHHDDDTIEMMTKLGVQPQ